MKAPCALPSPGLPPGANSFIPLQGSVEGAIAQIEALLGPPDSGTPASCYAKAVRSPPPSAIFGPPPGIPDGPASCPYWAQAHKKYLVYLCPPGFVGAEIWDNDWTGSGRWVYGFPPECVITLYDTWYLMYRNCQAPSEGFKYSEFMDLWKNITGT